MPLARRLPLFPLAVLLAGAFAFHAVQSHLLGVKRPRAGAEIEVALPLFVQVVMAGGDRYLAASWAAVRALVTETIRMKPEDYQILGVVQRDAAWLNPAHEDNYYIAAAILPWEGQLDAAQDVLRRATAARPFDYQPPFYYAFNLFHFKGDSLTASDWLRRSAPRLPDPDERLAMENLAARWLDRTSDLESAAQIVEAMAAQSHRRDFARYLRQRAQRLRDLAALRRAATAHVEKFGRAPRTLGELVAGGLVTKLPEDPFGFGFGLDRNGVPILFNEPQK